jgi:hypothetical protein
VTTESATRSRSISPTAASVEPARAAAESAGYSARLVARRDSRSRRGEYTVDHRTGAQGEQVDEHVEEGRVRSRRWPAYVVAFDV